MADGLGVTAKMGIKTCSSWGEAWSAVDTIIPFSEESLQQTIEWIERTALVGPAGKLAPPAGLIKVPGRFKADFDYGSFATLLECAMGAVSAGVYTITDSFAKIFRMELDKGVSRYRFDGVMIDELVISGENGKAHTIEFGVVCRSLSRSATAFPSLSWTPQSPVLFNKPGSGTSRIRLGDQADALGSGDETAWSKYTLSLKRNIKMDLYANTARTILQPRIDGKRDSRLEISVPVYSADTVPDWKDSATRLQADLYFGDGSNTCLIEVPELLLESGFDAPVSGPNVLTLEGEAGCYLNKNNTPMAAITNEFRITLA